MTISFTRSMQQVLDLAADVLKHVPETIDYEATYKLVVDDMNPLNVVLLQEVGWLVHCPRLFVRTSLFLCNKRPA